MARLGRRGPFWSSETAKAPDAFERGSVDLHSVTCATTVSSTSGGPSTATRCRLWTSRFQVSRANLPQADDIRMNDAGPVMRAQADQIEPLPMTFSIPSARPGRAPVCLAHVQMTSSRIPRSPSQAVLMVLDQRNFADSHVPTPRNPALLLYVYSARHRRPARLSCKDRTPTNRDRNLARARRRRRQPWRPDTRGCDLHRHCEFDHSWTTETFHLLH